MKTRRFQVTTIEVDDITVTLEYNPDMEPTTHQPTPTTLVVGYLRHDSDCENPMTSCDCEGTLYTLNEGVITDDSSAPGMLGLTDFGGSYNDLEPDLELDGIDQMVANKIEAIIKGIPTLTAWMVACVMEKEDSYDRLLMDIVDDMQGERSTNHDWQNDEDQAMLGILPTYITLAEAAWQELYNEGKIGEYLAVPVSYCSNNHGPGTASAHTSSLDDCNAVWVPDAFTISNMSFPEGASYLDKLSVAAKYASGVLENYVKWANGECYGVVVETFVLEGGEYVKVGDTDSGWGFIGSEYAEEALKESMDYAVDKFKEEA